MELTEIYNYDEKKEFKKTATKCSLALLIYVALQYVLLYAAAYAGNALIPHIANGSLPVFVNKNTEFAAGFFTTILSFLIVFCGFFRKSFFASLKGRLTFDEVQLKTAGKGLCAMMLAALAGGLVYSCFNFALGLFGHSYDAEELLNPQYSGIAGTLYIIYGCLVAPAFEELIFRGYLLGSLKKYSSEAAIFISAAMFSLMHGLYAQLPLAFLAGLVLGCTAVYSGSLLTPVLMHILYNTSMLISERQQQNEALSGILSFIFFAACIYGGIIVIKAIKGALWSDGKDSGKYCGLFFSRITALLFAAVHLAIGASFIK